MGDRGNIVVQDGQGARVWLYTHWDGSDLPKMLQDALKRGESRWDDAPYLARIVFCDMIKEVASLTGFGISARFQDTDRPILVINTPDKLVEVEADPRQLLTSYSCVGKKFSFGDYCDIENVSWERLNYLTTYADMLERRKLGDSHGA